MPIYGLTDQPPALVEIGRIRKGAKKEPGVRPKDLDYFRVTFSEFEQATALRFATLYDAMPRVLHVMLPFDEIAYSWDAFFEAYIASSMIYQSDGQQVIMLRDAMTGEVLVRDGIPFKKCEAKSGKPVGQYRSRNGQLKDIIAKPRGRLRVVIPKLGRYGILVMSTGSQWDIANISKQLDAVYTTHGTIAGIPFLLKRTPKMISSPMEDGKRQRVKKWLVSIEPDPDWVKAKMIAMVADAMPEVIEGVFRLPEPSNGEDEEYSDAPPVPSPTVAEAVNQVENEIAGIPPEPPPVDPDSPIEEIQDEPPLEDHELRTWPSEYVAAIMSENLAADPPHAMERLKRSPWARKDSDDPPSVDIVMRWIREFGRAKDEGLSNGAAAKRATERFEQITE